MDEANRKFTYGVLVGILGAFAGGATFYVLKAARQAKADAEFAQATGSEPPRPASSFGSTLRGNATTDLMGEFPY